MADAFRIHRDRLLEEVDNVYHVLVRNHNSGLVLCKCDDCTPEDNFVWERSNFVHRSNAYRHMLAQCKRKRTVVTQKDKQKDFSFWVSPDPMHTIKNEVNAICVMANGGSRDIYSLRRLVEVAHWEINYNRRWQEILGPYLAGLCNDNAHISCCSFKQVHNSLVTDGVNYYGLCANTSCTTE